jgi:hypothetical protein
LGKYVQKSFEIKIEDDEAEERVCESLITIPPNEIF